MSFQLRTWEQCPQPPAIPVTRSSMSSSRPWFLCLLAVSPLLFLTLVLLRGAAAQGCLHGGSSRWSSNPYFQSLWQVLWNLFPQDLAMWDLETEPHLAGSLLPL